MPFEAAPGLLVAEAENDNPTHCDAIGCPCIIPKQLEEARSGPRSVTFWCPSTRYSATRSPRTRGAFTLGGIYMGN
jgi:hypothetical protein